MKSSAPAEPPAPGKSFQALVEAQKRGERENIRWFLALAALVLVNSAALLWWAGKDTNPLAWDQAIHTRAAFEYRDRFQNGGFLLAPTSFNYPPLYHLGLAAALEVTDDAADAGPIVNAFFFAILVLSVFGITRRYAGPGVALTAAIVVSAYPIMNEIARQSLIDLALTALVSLGVLCLIRSESFSRRGWSIGFGVVAGLGMLTKWTAAAYLLGPFLFAAAGALRRRSTKWMWISLALGAVMAAPWYAVNLVPMAARIGKTTALPPANGVILEGWLSWLWYPLALFEQLNLPFVLLFAAGLALAGWKKEFRPLTAWFLVSIFLFSLINNRNPRYSMPALPAAAILSVLWISRARAAVLGVVAGLALGVWGVYQFFPRPIAPLRAGPIGIPILQAAPPVAADWKHDEIIARVDELRPRDRYSLVVTLSNVAAFHGQTLSMSTVVKGKEGFSFTGPARSRWLEFAQFVLIKTGDLGPEFTLGTIRACLDAIGKSEWFPSLYKEAGRWPMPDGSEAILYQLSPAPARPLDAGLFRLSLGEVKAKNLVLRNAYLRADPISPIETAKGQFKDVLVGCETLEYKGLPIRNIRVKLIEPQLNVPLFMETQDIQLLGVKTIEPELSLDAAAVLDYLKKKAPWLEEPSVRFDGSTVAVSGKAKGVRLNVALDVRVENNAIRTRLLTLKAGGVPLPAFLIRAETDRDFPLTPGRKMPFHLNIGQVRGDGERLRIGPA